MKLIPSSIFLNIFEILILPHRNTTKQVSKDKQAISGGNMAPHQFMGSNTETVSVEDLVTFLYGPNPDFQYQIILKSDLPLPLYRERNFK